MARIDSLAAAVRRAVGKERKAILGNLVAIAKSSGDDESTPNVLAAIKLLFEFGWGKPTEMVEHSGTVAHPVLVVHRHYATIDEYRQAQDQQALPQKPN